MKKFWMIKNLLLAGFMAHAPLSGYASIPQESNKVDSVPVKSFYFALASLPVQAVETQVVPVQVVEIQAMSVQAVETQVVPVQVVEIQAMPAQAVEMQAGLAQVMEIQTLPTQTLPVQAVEIQAVEETASLMRAGLENLGAGDIRGVFALPTKENVHQTAGEIARVAFLDTAGGCFMYDSITSKMALCDQEEEVLVRDQEELVANSLSHFLVDSAVISREPLPVTSLGDDLCAIIDTITKSIPLQLAVVAGSSVGVPVLIIASGLVAAGTGAILSIAIVTVIAGIALIIVNKYEEGVICSVTVS